MQESKDDGQAEMCDITIKDILGPKLVSKETPQKQDGKTPTNGVERDLVERDPNFSLLTYSFNLNPALRHQISFEMGQMQSESELVLSERSNAAEPPAFTPVLSAKNPVRSKISLLHEHARVSLTDVNENVETAPFLTRRP